LNRLELAGQLMSLLFEDLFKKFNSDLKILVKKGLTRTNKSSVFDVTTAMSPKTITQVIFFSISTCMLVANAPAGHGVHHQLGQLESSAL
jgi:DNA-directed RNA polymerase beta subunit